ncbi:MAG: hypothetical protein Q4F63_06905 [Clostridia bacterium]|nr:hypothetical protein [Clostridia bacterium]
MKKLIYFLAAAAIAASLSGCNNGSDSAQSDNEAVSENKQTSSIAFSTNDFALYTTDDDLQPSKFLCMLNADPSDIHYNDKNAQYMSQFIETETIHVKEGDKENPGESVEKDLIRYINYTGSRDAVITVKGITTTGLDVDSNDKCSPVEDVITAYGIDTENEAYIEGDIFEDGSYTIRLNFTDADENGKVERIISPKDTDLSSTDAKYSIRFNIKNDYVHGISYFMNY